MPRLTAGLALTRSNHFASAGKCPQSGCKVETMGNATTSATLNSSPAKKLRSANAVSA